MLLFCLEVIAGYLGIRLRCTLSNQLTKLAANDSLSLESAFKSAFKHEKRIGRIVLLSFATAAAGTTAGNGEMLRMIPKYP